MKCDKFLELLKKYKINVITDDSRNVKSNCLFTAYKGELFDRRNSIPKLLDNEAISNLIILKDSEDLESHEKIEFIDKSKKITVITYYDLRKNIGKIAQAFYKNNNSDFNFTGVTGTNGKTSIVYILTAVLELLGKKASYIGTLGTNNKGLQKVKNTTPGAIELQKILAEFKKNNTEFVNMEASSHALIQDRLSGVVFDSVIFTNLSNEHLDYHKSMDDYFNAKLKLFQKPYINDNTTIVINHDDIYGIKILKQVTKLGLINKVISYGSLDKIDSLKKECNELFSMNYSFICFTKDKIVFSELKDKKFEIKTNLIGQFNLYNLLAAICVLYDNKFLIKDILKAIENIKAIPGRLQLVESSRAKIYVDYAHTPDALLNILKELDSLKNTNNKGKLICVFGCGGDRDKSKRQEMGKIAVKYADKTFITDDNPRTENPKDIVSDIISNLNNQELKKTIIYHDRMQAIKYALEISTSDDIILIAGKGHEDYQIYGDKKNYFSDVEAVKSLVNEQIR